MSLEKNYVIVKLSETTVFPDLNKDEGKEANFARDSLKVQRLKYKHFKHIQSVPDEQQMQQLLIMLTGLSESDIDELYAEDVAEITAVIYGFMDKFIRLAKKMSEGS